MYGWHLHYSASTKVISFPSLSLHVYNTGRGVSSARTWPDSDTDSEGAESWAAMPGKLRSPQFFLFFSWTFVLPLTCIIMSVLITSGTVGEWLRYVASPLERRNFEELLETLEDFQFDRGLQQRDGAHACDGVLLRLGSMLHAKITFHITT